LVISDHGCVCCCVGPVIDVKLRLKVFSLERALVSQLACVYSMSKDMFLPSIYDALVVTRPSCNFRDGAVVTNAALAFGAYFVELPFNDSYLFGVIHLISADYSIAYEAMCHQSDAMGRQDLILEFAAVFLFLKSYASCLVAELSQLCYGGVLRAIALASTEGLCTFSCGFVISVQPVIVPVGRIALGRILNVVGSSIDRYLDMALSSQFQCSASCGTSSRFSSCSSTSYPLSYPASIVCTSDIVTVMATSGSLDYFCMLSLALGESWCIYLACLYGSLQLNNWTPPLCAVAASRIEFINFSVVRSQLIKSLAPVIYNSDALYASIRPVHKTPLAIMELSVSVRLFETGIKVVDLLTPYKSGGKIGLFGGAGVGKTVVIMEPTVSK